MTARHLFLTGEKGVGKSTLIDRLLSRFPGRVGGFRTVRVDTVRPGEATVHLLRVSGGEQPGEGNLLFSCAAPGADMALRFETLGRAALSGCGRCGLILMDELGPHEAAAPLFQRAVLEVLDGPTPVLGVLQRAGEPFLRSIAARADTAVLEVTRENRDALALLIELAGR